MKWKQPCPGFELGLFTLFPKMIPNMPHMLLISLINLLSYKNPSASISALPVTNPLQASDYFHYLNTFILIFVVFIIVLSSFMLANLHNIRKLSLFSFSAWLSRKETIMLLQVLSLVWHKATFYWRATDISSHFSILFYSHKLHN